MKIKKEDKVKVIAGKDKGKTGKVLQVFSKEQKLSIEGVNLSVKQIRSKQEGQKGQKIQFPAPIAVSSVMLICPKCNKPTRIGITIQQDKLRVRRCIKCKQIIS